jgi:hypothetical protein
MAEIYVSDRPIDLRFVVGCSCGTLSVMKVLILYRPRSEQASSVESFIRDFKMRHETGRIETVDADSRDGIATATLYDVMHYPAILALRDDGSVVKSWEGEQLPLMDELTYYTTS